MGFNRVSIKEISKDIIGKDIQKIIIIGVIICLASGNIPLVRFPRVINLILSILSSVFSFGLAKFALNKVRGQQANVEDVTYGFNFAGKIIIMAILIAVLTTLGFMCFVVPGVILTMMFSMSTFILVENPNKSIDQCLRESKDLVYGVKGELFIFYLSFLGWAILSGLIWGLGSIILTPYIVLCEAQIYLSLKRGNYGKENINYSENVGYTENSPNGGNDNFTLKDK